MELNQKYQRESFLYFLKESLLTDFDKDIRTVNTQGLSSIVKAFSLGKSNLLDLQIFEFEFAGSSRKRVTLTKEAFKLMRDSACYQALAVFHSANSKTWRFSFLTADPVKTEKGSVGLVYSNPKRYSFLLGVHAKTNTPRKYLVEKGKITDLQDLKKRFSIEVVNKDFYKEVSDAFTQLVEGKLKLPSSQNRSQTNLEFAVRLIGRVIFCWFLREKRSSTGHSLMPAELISEDAVKDISDYYHKILEPIFFEILNRPMKSRKDTFSKDLFTSIPYLNGGLFSPHEDDFYSYNEGKQAINHNTVVVPDEWFKSFFAVLETYNFTIDENTSYDEELSIDPEMLGRIFENLLAEINPETGESARKGTGSYYTPRVIVDYMVDESLLLYLKEKTQISEEKLRALISYDLDDDLSNPLSEEDKEKITKALNSVKILDPACGSGAFPIGALQKIVFVLQQIDPDGQHWFKNQIQNTPIELRRLIEREFKEKNFDYLRKLGIIRENIYGIDIQPIATEISRLRCFLTLIVDERIDETLENRGIEPLPNLDFKFVTANSLIGLPETESSQGELFDDNAKIDQLKSLRDQYFNARNEERKDLIIEFSDLQSEMINELIDRHSFTGVAKAELTRKLTDWKPFKHKKTDWFDPEWMFGIKNGFDIVIANPPYLKERDNKAIFEEINLSDFGKKYHQGKMDFWYYFLHKAIDLVKKDGCISYITSRYWITSFGAKKLIARVHNELSFINFVDIGKLKVFDEVAGQHMVGIYIKSKNIDNFTFKKLSNNVEDIGKNISTDNLEIIKLQNSKIFSNNDEIILETGILITDNCELLGDITDISQGVVEAPDRISRKAINKIPDSNINVGDGVFVLSKKELNGLKLNKIEQTCIQKYVDPNNIYPFHIDWANKYLIYADGEIKNKIKSNPDYINLKQHLDKYRKFITSSNRPYGLHRPRNIKYFINPKIIFKGMFTQNGFAYDDDSYFAGMSFSLIIKKDNRYDLKYILAILNSKLALYWFYKNGKKRGAGVDVGVEKLRQFPIKYLSPTEQFKFINLVDIISSIYRSNKYSEINEKMNKVNIYIKEINQLVYKLYGLNEQEIKIVEIN